MSITNWYYKSYTVSGKTLCQVESMESPGKIVDISRCGVRIRTEIKPYLGEEITARLKVNNYPRVLGVRGLVVCVQSDSWAMMFLEEPVGLANLLQFLDEEAK